MLLSTYSPPRVSGSLTDLVSHSSGSRVQNLPSMTRPRRNLAHQGLLSVPQPGQGAETCSPLGLPGQSTASDVLSKREPGAWVQRIYLAFVNVGNGNHRR